MRSGFLTAGTWCVDRNITVDAWPAEDLSARVRDVQMSGGGSGCNFAMDIKRLDPDMHVETTALLGAGENGDFLIKLADDAGIKHRFARTDQATTQSTDAYYSRASQRRTHILFMGTAELLTPDHLDITCTTARIFHLGLPGVHEKMDAPWGDDANGWVTTLKRARDAGLHTNLELLSVEPETVARLAFPCLPHLDSLIINDYEAGALSDLPCVVDGKTDLRACLKAAHLIIARGAMACVTVHSVQGAISVDRDGNVHMKPSVRVPADQNRGANGAGDAFAAGFLYGWHQGQPIDTCLTWAHASAASCLRDSTASNGVGTISECLGLANAWGWRETAW